MAPNVGDAPVGLVQQCRIGPAEDVLPAQTIGRNQDDVAGGGPRLLTRRDGGESWPDRQNEDHSADHDHYLGVAEQPIASGGADRGDIMASLPIQRVINIGRR